ncbi:hypothetical protein GF351_02605 [Candidatus Woesearchaeota archaeon]|nr:hypothetical protein [Candidatus Woesearchaeota archaeon]
MADDELLFIKKEDYFDKYDEEVIEEGPTDRAQIISTGYPKPVHRYRLVHESFQASIEESYFWILNYLRHDMGYVMIDKIMDVFAASEHSAFFGVAQQRVGLQQDKVSQFLATIGKMVKELFQLVRELRILDERLHYYSDSFDTSSPSRQSAEITLKGIFIDMVEGGSKNAASVYGMARELQFVTLPDLFFSTNPPTIEAIDKYVDELDFNEMVKRVLKRKLRAFMEWKFSTYKELKTRRLFTLKYLRQHYEIIRLYMNWVKPYLRNIARLQSEKMELRKSSTPDLISAFEGSLVEIELMARAKEMNVDEWWSTVLATFEYRTRPSMSFQQEGYQRGPLHVGEVKITLRGYAWNDDDVDNYIAYRSAEDFELIGLVDASVKAALEALGDELLNYLKEAGSTFTSEGKLKKPVEKPTLGPKGLMREIFGAKKESKGKKVSPFSLEKQKKAASSFVKNSVWYCYKNYKKAHKMMSW